MPFLLAVLLRYLWKESKSGPFARVPCHLTIIELWLNAGSAGVGFKTIPLQHGFKDRHNESEKYLRVFYNAAEFESIQVRIFLTWVACAWSFPLACQRQVPSSSSCNRINVHGRLSRSPRLSCARRRILSSPWGAYNQPSINTFKPKTHLRKASALPKWHPSAHFAISAIAVPLPPPISNTSL